ncbi:DUF6873 family GME fold protein [Candidatus Clostridium radicumherbarum]|uniref:DUF6873 family GME fold protein n=1 Tax=Candidatus Clostridium radicumherbarum TaxID=3381662 RepID=A0ABW8TW26_9CLOT
MKAVLVDYRIDEDEKENLKALKLEVLTVPPFKRLYKAVCGHPDMLLNIVNENTIIVHKEMDINFVKKLENYKYKILYSSNSLNSKYPLDIILNALNLKNLFLHNLKYTDNALLQNISSKKVKSVSQGYTKCSTAIISSSAVMTGDKGIAKSLSEENIDVLLLPPGDIILPGLNYGFIGGCCGLLEDGLLAFYGHLDNYLYGYEVKGFLKKHKVEPIFLSKDKLFDRGSIFVINN